MSKLYIVTQGEYSDYYIDSVFSNKEQAEKRALIIADNRYGDAHVEEYELDEIVIQGDVFKYYEVIVVKNPHIYRTYGKQKPEELKVRKMEKECGGEYVVTGIRADDEETALKIAQDAVAKYRYLHEVEEAKNE